MKRENIINKWRKAYLENKKVNFLGEKVSIMAVTTNLENTWNDVTFTLSDGNKINLTNVP